MKACSLIISFLVLTAPLTLDAQGSTIVRPAPGTTIRKAVCNEMRRYLRYSGEVDRAFGHFLFKVEDLAVQVEYCVFEGYAVDENGDSSDYLPDVVYTTFLKKTQGGWEVIEGLSRGDVPSDEGMREIRRTFPKRFPQQSSPNTGGKNTHSGPGNIS